MGSEKVPTDSCESDEDEELSVPSVKTLMLDNAHITGPMFLSRVFETVGNIGVSILISNLSGDSLAASGLITATQNALVLTLQSSLNATSYHIGRIVKKKNTNSCSANDVGVGEGDIEDKIEVVEESQDEGAFFREIKVITYSGQIVAFILSAASIPILVFSGDILVKLGQDAEISKIVEEYFRAYVIGLPAQYLLVGGEQFVIGQKHMLPVVALNFLKSALSISLGYFFSYKGLGLGVKGVGYATAISSWVTYFSYLGYLFVSRKYKEFNLFRPSFGNPSSTVWKLFKSGCPISFRVGAELASLMSAVIMAGILGRVELSAAEIAIQFTYFLAIPIYSISRATGVLVSNRVGLGRYKEANKLGYLSMAVAQAIPFVGIHLALFIPRQIVSLFLDSGSPIFNKVLETAKTLMLINSISRVPDSIRHISGSVFSGYDYMLVPALLSVANMSILAPLLSYLSAFQLDFGVVGIFSSRAVAMTSGAAMLSYCLWRYNHEDHTKKQEQRSNPERGESGASSGFKFRLFAKLPSINRSGDEEGEPLLNQKRAACTLL